MPFSFFKTHCRLEGFLDCSLCCSTPLFWADLWKFLSGMLELSRRYLRFTHSQAGSSRLARNQAASSNACVIDRRWHTVLSMLVLISINMHWLLHCKSKCSTPKVITGHYVITLRSAFGQTIEVEYSPSLLSDSLNLLGKQRSKHN